MLALIVCCVLLSISSHVECKYSSDYGYYLEAGGWLKLHKATATWQQAFEQCHYEGAVLASPVTSELRQVMELLIDNNDNNLLYYIGANSKYSPGHYVSVEGVPIEHMPVGDKYRVLDTEHGECLSMDGYNISVSPCSTRLPYLCYAKEQGRTLTECGTFDKEYHLATCTGSCYKVHRHLRTWVDANAMCISEGAYLAIVNDNDEAEIIKNMIPDMKLPWYGSGDWSWHPMFVGFRDWTEDGIWLSNEGGELDEIFSSWDISQPDADGHYCGAINKRGKVDNIWCRSHPSFFICEKDPRYIRYSSENAPRQPTVKINIY